MIFDEAQLKNIYKRYSNKFQKIGSEKKKNNITRIMRGVYTNDLIHDGPLLANFCYGPSYISFEYALAKYNLIPEYVSTFTCATYNKRKTKEISTKDICILYRDIPAEAFPYEVTLVKTEKDYIYKIATPEKALCDELYSKYQVRNYKDLEILLFEDLRIDVEEFVKLNFKTILELIPLYHCTTLNTLRNYILRRDTNEITTGFSAVEL